ncbi:MAG: hypothetical protein AAF636_20860 [Pseudomonadota bacterium]
MKQSAKRMGRISKVLVASYEAQQFKLQSVLEDESLLRQEIDLLKSRALDAQTHSCESMLLVGADMIWQTWVERKIVQLNAQLAQVLALKDHELTQLRKEFGKKTAAEKLHNRALNETQNRKRKFYEAVVLQNCDAEISRIRKR